MIEPYIQALLKYARTEPTDYGDGESVLTMLYECYIDSNRIDDEQSRSDFTVGNILRNRPLDGCGEPLAFLHIREFHDRRGGFRAGLVGDPSGGTAVTWLLLQR